ncbi:hypothetical protein SAMN04488109_4026 [Chryseolinea serpens]|uniref:Outer membrane protein beta-barrel domain-containing protein n=1 Tax=Chryseolinea serpens TaxID=947013 RepID=A0A1M5TEF3_9BACT|nr:hypothetical protein [Chryseolinea serpens]SHH49102.1 hypothetical protein SAMN04488109_4026 [Chryseolinea serpens]
MKNLREHEAFKALENRLSNYTEQPDDDLWQKIAAGLPSSKPVWSPWMNQFAGIVVVAALGWALGYRSAQEAGGNPLAIAQPKSASLESIVPDHATGSQIREENAGAKDALPQAGQQGLTPDTFTNKKSTRSNQRPGSSLPDAGSGISSKVRGARSLSQPSGSARDLSSDFDSQTGARPPASQASGSSLVSSIDPASNQDRHSNLQPDQSTSYTEAKAFDAVADRSLGSAKQESSLNNLSSHDRQPIKPADRTRSTTTLSTPEAKAFDVVADGSQGSAKQESSLNNLSSQGLQAIKPDGTKSTTTLSTTETKAFDGADVGSVGSAKQESSLHPSSANGPQAIKPADGIKSSTTLSTQNLHSQPIAGDSSQQEKVFTNLSNADSAVTDGQRPLPYNRPKKKREGISFYALFSPTLSFHTATPSARDGVIIQKFNKPSILSADRLGLGLEFGVQGRLAKKLEYFAGLSVYHQSQTLRYTYQSSGSFVIQNSGDDLSYTVEPNTTERSVSYSMLNVGAQAGVLYTLKESRLSHKIGLGLQYQKGLSHASSGEPYDNASSSYLNYQVLYRAEMTLNGHLTVIVQPSVTRTWLVNETLQVPFTLKQYRPGVSIGLLYKFTR